MMAGFARRNQAFGKLIGLYQKSTAIRGIALYSFLPITYSLQRRVTW